MGYAGDGMLIALYRCKFDGRPLDTLINMASGFGGHSHAEVVFQRAQLASGHVPLSFSSTSREPSVDHQGRSKPDGTRFKFIDYRRHPERWTLYKLPHTEWEEFDAYRWCSSKYVLDARYDYKACGRFLYPRTITSRLFNDDDDRFICSGVTTCAARVRKGFLSEEEYGVADTISPNKLDSILSKSCELLGPGEPLVWRDEV
jgi:hypothetical protein